MSEWYIDELTGTLEKANQEWLFIASHSLRALNKAGSRYKRNLLHTSSHSAWLSYGPLSLCVVQSKGLQTLSKRNRMTRMDQCRATALAELTEQGGWEDWFRKASPRTCSAPPSAQYLALWSVQESLDNQWRDYQTVSVISATELFEVSHGCLPQPEEVMLNGHKLKTCSLWLLHCA